MLNKHKLFLLCAKWIPVVTAIGILVTNFDNYVRAGIIPKGKKEIGFNELSWSLKDFDGVKLQRIHKK